MVRQSAAAALVSFALVGHPAWAQDRAPSNGCLSQGGSVCVPGRSARLSAATKDVLLSQGAGFAVVPPGTNLAAGDRLLVRRGSASLALGPSCHTKVGPNSLVTVTQDADAICVSRVSADPETTGQVTGGEGGPPASVPGLNLGATVALGGAVGAGGLGLAVAGGVIGRNNGRANQVVPQTPSAVGPFVTNTPSPF